jgi:hypothetical protein
MLFREIIFLGVTHNLQCGLGKNAEALNLKEKLVLCIESS